MALSEREKAWLRDRQQRRTADRSRTIGADETAFESLAMEREMDRMVHAAVRRRLKPLEDKIDELAKQNKTLEEQNKINSDESSKIKQENSAHQAKQLEIFGVLVALFTFVSVQMQIFANINKLFFFPLSLLSLSGLFFFVALLSIINATRLYTARYMYLGVSAIFAVVAFVLVIAASYQYHEALRISEQCSYIQSQAFTRGISEEDMTKIMAGDKEAIQKVTSLKNTLNMANCPNK